MKQLILTIGMLCWLTGCSVLAPVSKGYLQANVAAYEALPVTVQQANPEFIQSIYFSASVLVTPPADWQLQLRSPYPLTLPTQVPVTLQYRHAGQSFSLPTLWQQQVASTVNKTPVALAAATSTPTPILAPTQALAAKPDPRPYIYVLVPHTEIASTEFWQRYQALRWAADKPEFDYFLQPELAIDTSEIELGFQLAGHGGFLSVGGFARKMLKGTTKLLANVCQSQQYRYRRVSACGSVQIRELADSAGQAGPAAKAPAPRPASRR